VRYTELLRRFKEERSILRTVKLRLTGLVRSCTGNAAQSIILKYREQEGYNRREDDEEDGSSCRITSRERMGTEN
jgi:hypothetical protein